MMENLKLEHEQSKQEMSELVKAISNMPPPVGRLKHYISLHSQIRYLTNTCFF